ncbi:MAG: hypothetical protein Tsb009_05370 [Planctomycetaceae bacterium]
MRPASNPKLLLFLVAVLCLLGIAGSWWTYRTGLNTDEPAPRQNSTPADVKDEKLLPLTERKRVWDIEHLAFLFEAEVFPVWKKAIAHSDRETLERAFHSDFVGRVSQTIPRPYYTSDSVRITRTDFSEASGKTVTAREMIDALFALRKHLDSDPKKCKVGMGLVRFGPVDLKKPNGAWQTVWKLRLAGTRGGHRVEIVARISAKLEPVDERIGQRTHWLRSATIEKIITAESPRALLQDVTAQTGIVTRDLHDNWSQENSGKFRTKTGGVYVCDYNNDGNLDVLVEDLNIGARLYRGLGNGRFQDVTSEAGLPQLEPGTSPLWTVCCWADFDGDGDEDLILQDKLFENRGDGTFLDITRKTNLLLTPAASYAVGDFDLDGRIDLYVCHSGKYLVGQKLTEQTPWIDGGLGIDNILWRNTGNWQFEDVTQKTNAGAGGTACFAAVWLDANNDRWPDLLAINEFGKNTLLINHKGRFSEKTIDPVFGGFSMGVTAGDFNNDGHADLYVANMYSKAGNRIISNVDRSVYPAELYRKVEEATTGNKLYLSRGDGTFEVAPPDKIVPDIGWAYGPGFVDLNGDGWLDIYSTAGFRSVERGKPDG